MEMFERMAAEHEALMADVGRIRSLATAPDTPAERAALRDALEAFRAATTRHFALEEEGGYMTEVTDTWPSLVRKVGELLADHAEITRRLDAMLEPSFRVEDLRREALEVIEILRRHEEKESSLMRKMVNLDMGVAD